jgi:hypothetical protein
MNRVTCTLTLFALSAGLAACDGDSHGDDAKIKDLSADDQIALCQEMAASAADHAEGLARFTCLLATIFDAECNDAEVDACVADAVAAARADEPDCSQPFNPEALPSCEATVGELRTCLGDVFAGFDAFAGPTCDDLTEDFEQSGGGNPPSCVAAEAKCPGLFEDAM